MFFFRFDSFVPAAVGCVLFIVRSTVVTIASPLVVLGRVTCCDDGDAFAWVPDPSYSQ